MQRADSSATAGGGAAVNLQGLSKSYGETLAVADLDLSIAPGEFFTILGPSGSGKTTTLRMIAGFVPPTRGRILADERDVTALAPQKREIGMVFQNYALFPHLSVFENVAFALKVRGLAAEPILQQVHQALELVRLSGMENRLPHQLSGGQQQRVAFARAIVFRPRVLLLDEPLGALDKKLREHMQLEIKQLQRKLKVTVIYITHDQEEALTMSDRVAVMNLGRIEQVGSPADLYERPENRFVAQFLGESNFIDGVVTGLQAGELRIRIDDGADISARSSLPFQEGDRVSSVLRPEHLWLGIAPSAEHSNSVPGVISETIYLGESVRYRVRLPSGMELVAKVPRRFGEKVWSSGDSVVASWRPSDATLFRRS